jgi:hypothetical protein
LSTYITLPVLPELLESDFLSLTIKEAFLLDEFFVKRQKLLSTKVCEVPEEREVELELLAESSFFEQEMRVRLKNADRKMKIILFINQLIPKVKYYGLVLKNLEVYQNMWCFTSIRKIVKRMSSTGMKEETSLIRT